MASQPGLMHEAKVQLVNAWKPSYKDNLVDKLVNYDYGEPLLNADTVVVESSELADCELDLVEANEELEVPRFDKIMMDIMSERDGERIFVTKEVLRLANETSDPYNIFTNDELSHNFNEIYYLDIGETDEEVWLRKTLNSRKVSNSKASSTVPKGDLSLKVTSSKASTAPKGESSKAASSKVSSSASSGDPLKVSNGAISMPKPWPFNQTHNQKVEIESNAWKVPQQSSKENIPQMIPDEALFPQERPPNDWDLIKTPPRPKPKKRGKFIKRKWFAGDKVAVWYKNEFYVGKIILVTPAKFEASIHLPDWDYEKDKEIKITVTRPQDEIYRLRTFDLEGREETKHIRWQEGDFCWAWYTNENEYYSAWFQKFDETNPNYCHVVFDGFEDDGLYMCACNFVIPNYMWNRDYITYNLKNDKDLILDQAKTTAKKEAALLRRARNARKARGENKEFYLQPLEEERPWGENGVVGMTSQPTTLKKKYEPALPPTPAGPSYTAPSSSLPQHPLPVSVPKTFKFVQRKKPEPEVEEEFEEAVDSEQSDVEDDGFTMPNRDLPSYVQMGGTELGFGAQFTPVVCQPPPYVPPQAYAVSDVHQPSFIPPYVPPEGQAYGSPESVVQPSFIPPYVPPEAYLPSSTKSPPPEEVCQSLGNMKISDVTEPSPFSSLTKVESSPFGMTNMINVENMMNEWNK